MRRTPDAPIPPEITPHPNDGDLIKLGLEHARAWMILHADQRLRALNFWLLSAAFLTTAYVTTIVEAPVSAAVVALVGLLTTLAFERMEQRTHELVHRAEEALRPLEERLATMLAVDQLKLVERSATAHSRWSRYSMVIAFLQRVAIGGFGLAFVSAVARWLRS